MKPAENLLRSLRRKIALNPGNDKDQDGQQDHDLDDVIKKELNASTHSGAQVHTAGSQNRNNQSVQPGHTQNFILKKVPGGG